MSTETLTSLAMLKVKIDQGQDYFDHLRPFVIQVFLDEQQEPIQDGAVNQHVRKKFGLQVPTKTVQLVLKRLVDAGFLKKRRGKYQIMGDLPDDTSLTDRKHEAETHINTVISGLMQFADTLGHSFSGKDAATTAICAFLSEFNIQCLRAYQGNTIIPSLKGSHEADIVLVSKYITHIQTVSVDQFNSFIHMVEGHMCANALLCPDLKDAPQTYEKVTFYLDTPLLIPLTGMNGTASKTAVEELLVLLHKLGGKTAVFSHSKKEVESVLHGAANNLYYGYGQMVVEAKRRRMSKSDLLDIAAQIDETFGKAEIELVQTPWHEAKFQISEVKLGQFLDREVQNYRKRAQEYDINSVRSIYALRRGSHPATIEEAQSVFVTSNQAFARGAWRYAQKHENREEIATVITDFSLANIAWLKSPMIAPELPQTEILALCHAAVQPKEDFIDEFLDEVDKLEKGGEITDRRLQALRSVAIYSSLMALTLGSKDALTKDNIYKIADSYEQEVARGERKKHEAEKQKMQAETDAANRQLWRARIFARKQSRRKARVCVWLITAISVLFLLAGTMLPILSNFGVLQPAFLSYSDMTFWIFSLLQASVIVTVVFTFMNLLWGANVRGIYRKLYNWLYNFFLTRTSSAMGIDVDERSFN